MNPIMLKGIDILCRLKGSRLKRASEGGMKRKISQIAVEVKDSVPARDKEYLSKNTFDTLEDIAIRNNIKILIAGKNDKTLVNAGAHTKLMDKHDTQESFDNEILGFVNESMRKNHIGK